MDTKQDSNAKLLPCPFCGSVPELPHGMGTQYDMECDCGMAMSCVQICDLMTIEERVGDPFTNNCYKPEYVARARDYVIEQWNNRS